jgi:dihydroorotase
VLILPGKMWTSKTVFNSIDNHFPFLKITVSHILIEAEFEVIKGVNRIRCPRVFGHVYSLDTTISDKLIPHLEHCL